MKHTDTRRSPVQAAPATDIKPGMNSLQRLIRNRMVELDLSYQQVADAGGIPKSTVHNLAKRGTHRQFPRSATLAGIARGLQVPVDVVRAAATEAAGYQLKDITTTLEDASSLRILAAAHGEMSPTEQATLRRIAIAMLESEKARRLLEELGE